MSWSIIITASSREKRLALALSDAGHEAFLPLRKTWSGKYAKHAEIRRPIIPGYVFAVIEPHQIHAFHSDGAIRILTASRYEQAQIDACLNGWAEDVANGLYDDPEPATRLKPVRARNRRKHRAKHTAVPWEIGLQSILSHMMTQTALAA